MTDAWQPGTTVLEEFGVERILGSGGFGSVALLRALRSGERYAAKRLHETGSLQQGLLIGEARRWMALPPHPYITECRFTRTVQGRLVVFSEYVPGGSLADRIRSGELYGEGGPEALRRALGAAAQVAYGLDAAHSAGLLHLDVKPGNILFDEGGAAKITDFGLAVAPRPATGAVTAFAPAEGGSDPWPTTRAPGHTQAYASPEQAEGRPVGPAADVWSWAVTLLEMLVGERTWPSGAVAALVLESARHQRLTDRSLAIPPLLAELLARCFHEDPRARPRSLRQLAAALRDVGEDETGGRLAVAAPPRQPTGETRKRVHGRRSTIGYEREDPWELLRAAYAAAGIDEAEAAGFRPQLTGGRRTQLLEELHVLNEAWRVLWRPTTAPRPLLRARCAASMAEVQEGLGDVSGAVERYRGCVRLLESLPTGESRGRLSPALNSLAVLLRRQGAVEESVRVADRAIATARQSAEESPAGNALGNALLTKANTLLGQDGAEPLFVAAVAAMRSAGDEVGEAKALASLAGCLARRGSPERAHLLWDEADRMLARHATPEHHDVQAARGALWLQRASEAEPGSDTELTCARTAVSMYAPLVRDHGVHEYSGSLGQALFRVGRCEERRGMPQTAHAAYGLASEYLETAVLRDGLAEFTEHLARSYDHESRFVADLQDPERAVGIARRAVDMWRRVADMDGLRSTGGFLAEALRRLADALHDTGRMDEAEEVIAEGIRVTGDPAYRRDATGRLIAAVLHRTRGVGHRRSGRFDEAWHECATALDLLKEEKGTEATETRILVLETMSGTCSDSGSYRQALVIAQDVMAETFKQGRDGFLRDADLADAVHRLAHARFDYGLAGDAAVAAREALKIYDRIIARGRVDLAAEALRTRALLGECLLRTGELDDAAQELETALRAYETVSDRDLDRSMPRRHGSSPAGQLRTSLGESLELGLAEVREALGAGPETREQELDRRSSAYDVGRELFRSGARREASLFLERSAGILAWLAVAHPGEDVERIRAETLLLLATCAASCERAGAARYAFRGAAECLRRLTTDLGRPECADRWFEACVARVGWLVWNGDESEAQTVLEELHREVRVFRPAQRETWDRRAENSMAEARELRERARA
ncbi:serine/threonine-protein kinase [Streptomyces sp. NPDC097704]|uniref:serine/threonine-protein kinase n=1 Tax=Streptomyces sp. NPDC097704 TaxID=3157101 RepID=UPI00331AFC53